MIMQNVNMATTGKINRRLNPECTDATCGWNEQAGDGIVAGGGRESLWGVASGQTTVTKPSVRAMLSRVLHTAYMAFMSISSSYSVATHGEV